MVNVKCCNKHGIEIRYLSFFTNAAYKQTGYIKHIFAFKSNRIKLSLLTVRFRAGVNKTL